MSWTTNRTSESYKQNFTHVPKGEWTLREILEEVQRALPTGYVSFRTSDVPGRGDALLLGDEIIQCDGPGHLKQSTRNHDAYMEQQVREEGYRVWRFKEQEILYCPQQIKQILASLAVMKRILLERNRK